MKKFLIATLTTAVATSAQAGSLSLDLRADYNSTTYNKEAGKPDSTKYLFKVGRLDYQGKVTDDLSFRVRIAFNKDGTKLTDSPDSAQTAVEYASLSHKMSDMFTLTVGKFNTEFGGFEGAISGADRYLASEFYTRTAPTSAATAATGKLSTFNLGTDDLLYATGVKGSFTFEGQQIHLMATNESTNETAAGPRSTQNSSMMGLAWKGAFVEKALNFMVSYHTMAGPVKDDKHQFMAAGVMWNSSPIMVSADYLVSEFKQDASGAKDTMTSIVAKLAYTGWEQWTPRLEYTSSEGKQEIADVVTNKFTGMGAVLEFKPYNDQTFRYHLAYNNITEKPHTGDDYKKDEVVVGARLLADFLK